MKLQIQPDESDDEQDINHVRELLERLPIRDDVIEVARGGDGP